MLALPSGKITVADIIRALDGPIRIAECVDTEPNVCDFESLCPTKDVWNKINQAIVDALEGITLAEMRGSGLAFAELGTGLEV